MLRVAHVNAIVLLTFMCDNDDDDDDDDGIEFILYIVTLTVSAEN